MLKKIHKLFQILQQYSLLKALLKYRVAASTEHINILTFLQDQDYRTIVDVGANRGQFALIARNYFPDARIMSFEPLKEPAVIFKKIFRNDSQVTLYPFAVGSSNQFTTIHISHADDSSSLLPISQAQNSLYPGTLEKDSRTIQVKPLEATVSESEIDIPAFLKIDVQGFEKDVLEGCGSSLNLFSHIYIECSFIELYVGQSLANEVIAYLNEMGFLLIGIYNLDYDTKGQAIQGDFLFMNGSSR